MWKKMQIMEMPVMCSERMQNSRAYTMRKHFGYGVLYHLSVF